LGAKGLARDNGKRAVPKTQPRRSEIASTYRVKKRGGREKEQRTSLKKRRRPWEKTGKSRKERGQRGRGGGPERR